MAYAHSELDLITWLELSCIRKSCKTEKKLPSTETLVLRMYLNQTLTKKRVNSR